MPWRLLQYNGAFDDLWASCPEEERDSIRPRLTQLWLKGNLATFPVTEPLGDGLFEVRGRHKRVRIRFLFGFMPGQRIVFVWGGKKDQRRLPQAAINAARRLLAEAKATEESLHVVSLH
jgi:phage-related protein